MLKALFLAALLVSVLAVKGVDISQPFSTSTFSCMKNNGVTFVIPRAYCSFGGVDSHAVSNLQNAHSAGLSTDVYMFPCRGKNATSQVSELFSHVTPSLYSRVWIDVETNPSSGCSWSGHSAASNCDFVTEVAKAIASHSKTAGIYASRYMWESIMGSQKACAGLSSHPLWYAHYDKNPSFSDFVAFGGWTHPYMKQYIGDTTLCGAGVDYNYHA
jgi:GH25 family lysozyme M1 (1,4-beta-N-acetylmuramidase)